MTKPKIGLLPLYLALYDESLPEMRKAFEPFLKLVTEGFESRGVDVASAPICRIKPEFEAAVAALKARDVDLLVTLHLAYSPSLESVDVLVASDLPILVLDTTMDYEFGTGIDPERILYNHGIHGVQDLTSMLRRRGKPYHIVAGHVTQSNVMDRAADIARAAHAVRDLRSTRALRIGESFKSMADFAVEESELKRVLGVTVEEVALVSLDAEIASVTPEEIEREMALNSQRFIMDAPEEVHRRTVRLGLGLRKKLEKGGYCAFSMNFLAFDSPNETVPFLEACLAMERGVGYAGEGDVLTASLVGALGRAFGKTSFTEIFCPDWKGNTLFLSHMGEINPQLAASKPRMYEKPFPFTSALNPAAISCGFAPGKAVLVNLTPGPNDTFGLILAPVEILPDSKSPAMQDWVRGWIKPQKELGQFLEDYSKLGGTHHSAIVMGDKVEALKAFAQMAGMEANVI